MYVFHVHYALSYIRKLKLTHVAHTHNVTFFRERDAFLPEIGLHSDVEVNVNVSEYSRAISQPWVFVEETEEVINKIMNYRWKFLVIMFLNT